MFACFQEALFALNVLQMIHTLYLVEWKSNMDMATGYYLLADSELSFPPLNSRARLLLEPAGSRGSFNWSSKWQAEKPHFHQAGRCWWLSIMQRIQIGYAHSSHKLHTRFRIYHNSSTDFWGGQKKDNTHLRSANEAAWLARQTNKSHRIELWNVISRIPFTLLLRVGR